MKKIIFFIILLFLSNLSYAQVNETCENKTSIIERIIDTCKIPNNSICDDGENFIIDSDCDIKGIFFQEMWLIRLLLLITLIMIFKKNDNAAFLVIAIITLIVYNGDMGTTEIQLPIDEITESCWGTDFFKNMGSCVWPSDSVIGWVIIGVLVLLGLRLFTSKFPNVRIIRK